MNSVRPACTFTTCVYASGRARPCGWIYSLAIADSYNPRERVHKADLLAILLRLQACAIAGDRRDKLGADVLGHRRRRVTDGEPLRQFTPRLVGVRAHPAQAMTLK